MVINETLARAAYGDADPIGKRMICCEGSADDPMWKTVVGVVGDVKQFGLDKDAVAQVYVPLRQTPQGLAGRVLVRTTGDPSTMVQPIKNTVRSIDPDMPITNIRTLLDIRTEYLATPRLTAVLLSLFAGLALLVTMAGLGGVIGTSVAERTQEFGLRMALGARRDNLLQMVIHQGLRLVMTGLFAGVAASYAFTRVLSSYLFDTQAMDPMAIAAVLFTFVAAGILACLGPALRATTVDPLVALRAE